MEADLFLKFDSIGDSSSGLVSYAETLYLPTLVIGLLLIPWALLLYELFS